jgi:hypothetical protein
MVMFNPCGVDKVVGLVSVGFTYGYSRGGPLRGHIHLTFYPPTFCVTHPLPERTLFAPDSECYDVCAKCQSSVVVKGSHGF